MQPAASGAASVQWSAGAEDVQIGDAALARDALSSQGIAAGASEALFASAIRTKADAALFSARQAEQRASHLAWLIRALSQSRFADAPVWKEYQSFLSDHSTVPAFTHTAALRDEVIVPVPPLPSGMLDE